MKYGLFTVLNENRIYRDNRIYWLCRCECGTTKEVIIKNLKSGTSKSCGCLQKKQIIERSTTHGKRHTRVWRIWQAMKTRCNNEKMPQYRNYGGRGISYCKEWELFENFYKDMGEPPRGMSIDRIDNNRNYEPTNCKWSTHKEQGRNRSSNRKINGICITEISKGLGGRHSLVAKRLNRGWSVEKAITTKSNAIS